MTHSEFLLYGAYGYVGSAVARLAVRRGLRPILAGRAAARLAGLAAELGVEQRVVGLEDPAALDRALAGVPLVLHCAGPFAHTAAPMLAACLRAGAHYLDITGELAVFTALAAHDAQARARGVMLLPGVGFDVLPTDCLAAHLKRRLPSATRLTLAFQTTGPAGMPPGTLNTAIELLPYNTYVRSAGRIVRAPRAGATRPIDFGSGPVPATRLTWGDVFTAYYSTSIPNIETYIAASPWLARLLAAARAAGPLLSLPAVRRLLRRTLPLRTGATPAQRARSATHVWGQAADEQGRSVGARLHGPEAGLEWTALAALAATAQALAGDAPPGFQTPARAYGADFVLSCAGVSREDVE